MAGGAVGGMDAASGLGTVGLPASLGMNAEDANAVNLSAMSPWQRGLMQALQSGKLQHALGGMPGMNPQRAQAPMGLMNPRPMLPQTGVPSFNQVQGANPFGIPQAQPLQSVAPWMMNGRFT